MPEENLWSLIHRTISNSGSIEKAVFFLLVGFSLVSWTLVLWKICALYELKKNTQKFLAVFNNADSFGAVMSAEPTVGASPVLSIFKAALHAMETSRSTTSPRPVAMLEPKQISPRPATTPEDMVVVSMQHTSKAEFLKLSGGLGFLATIGSTSPFIGLFGTVWGIMDTFRELGNAKSASIQVVAPGISSALIATAAGLAVAIPAVMAYNWFLGQIDDQQEAADCFIERLSVLIQASGWRGSDSKMAASNVHSLASAPLTQGAPAPVSNPAAAPVVYEATRAAQP